VLGVLGLIFARLVLIGGTPARSTNVACPLIKELLDQGWRVGRPGDAA
jgi:hypothetical protein